MTKIQRKQKLKKLLDKWGIQDAVKPLPVAIKEVIKIKEVLKEVVPAEKLGQLFDSLSKISELMNSSKELTVKELSGISMRLNHVQDDLKETKKGLIKKEDFDTME